MKYRQSAPGSRAKPCFFCSKISKAFNIPVLIGALAMVFLCRRRAAAEDYPFELQAEYAIYVVDEKTINATGEALFNFNTLKVRADHLAVSMKRHWLTAHGNVVVESIGKTFEGDTLVFDMTLFQGLLVQDGDQIKKIYFQGSDIDKISSLTNVPENADITAEPSDSTLNIVCDRIRISQGGKFEAWNVSVWVKGMKALSASYYTNFGRGISNATVSLSQVRYSSRRKWTLGGNVRYLKRPGYHGYLGVSYNSMASKRYRLSLNQSFQVGATTGSLGVSGLGEAGIGVSVGFDRRLFEKLSGHFSFNWNRSSQKSFQAAITRHSINSSWLMDIAMYKYLVTGSREISTDITWDRPVHYVPKLGVGYGFRAYYTHRESYPNAGHYTNLSLNQNAFKSAIRINLKTFLSFSCNFMESFGAQGSSGFSFSTNLDMNRRIGKSDIFSINYSLSGSTTLSSLGRRYSSRSRTMKSSISFGSSGKWSLRTGARYDLVRDRFTSGDLTYSRWINQKLRFDTNMNYDFRRSEITYDRYTFTYDLYGLLIFLNWYNTTREWVVDFDLPF